MTRYDVAIIARRPSMRVAPQGVQALVSTMLSLDQLRQVQHTHGDGWEELHGLPGELAHCLFYDGPRFDTEPIFLELGIRYGDIDLDLGYGVDEPLHAFIEIRGARYNFVTTELLERVDSVMRLGPVVVSRVHEGLRSRAAETPPDGDDEPPAQPESTPYGPAGSRVEELD